MLCCSKKQKPRRLAKLDLTESLKELTELFEEGAVSVAAVISVDGSLLACSHQDEVPSQEVSRILKEVSVIKQRAIQVAATLGGGTSAPLHIRGKTSALSVYDIRDRAVLVLVFSLSPYFSETVELKENEAFIQDFIDTELGVKLQD
jgi:predicted regulator of Ras-like GTPase activity (Roadblock/LC7/MglB family)